MNDPVAVRRTVWLFVAVGVVARLVRYLADFPLWLDEYKLAYNLLDRDYIGLLRPLDHNQVAPIGFLWIELAVTRALGFSELSLRLFPFACSLASLFLFRYIATRILSGLPLVLAVAIFSVAYFPIRYCAEVKPYAGDLTVALAMFALFIAWQQAPEKTSRLWWLALVAPFCLTLSFPAVFIAGGLSAGIASMLWFAAIPKSANLWSGARAGWLAWGAFNLAVGLTFLGLLQLNIASQYDATRVNMVACWAGEFPPWRQPLMLALWLLRTHTSEMFAYPVGSENFGSLLTGIAFFTGLVVLWRQGRRDLLVVFAGCFGLSMLAALLQRYPYGGHARLSQYLAPFICLAAGCGAARLLQAKARLSPFSPGGRRVGVEGDKLPKTPQFTLTPDPSPIKGEGRKKTSGYQWFTPPRLVLATCLVIGAVSCVRDVARPSKTRLDSAHRAFARDFWKASPAETTFSVEGDLGQRLYTDDFETARACLRCYERICLARRQTPTATPPDTRDSAVRWVVYHAASARRDNAAFDNWLATMSQHYDLQSTETHQVPLAPPNDHEYQKYLLCYDVYHFSPRRSADESSTPLTAEHPSLTSHR